MHTPTDALRGCGPPLPCSTPSYASEASGPSSLYLRAGQQPLRGSRLQVAPAWCWCQRPQVRRLWEGLGRPRAGLHRLWQAEQLHREPEAAENPLMGRQRRQARQL